MTRRIFLCAVLAFAPCIAAAAELVLPSGARPVSSRVSALDTYDLPVAAFDGQSVPVRRIEGRVDRQTWRIASGPVTTLQVLTPLREQIEKDGFSVVLDCETQSCGGFDFRFGVEVVPDR